ncbi:hypothetical protein M0534_03765 [Methylonatrum kenyense]|uniref:hypothetical protein n=1 Tax=Methylonatrum kenyense TaxID=455253 RepID=UPI0020C08779|nr:hypothetical protein [Methylonatrum kenyense]MCK8515452.1 hypothetical protein [Methylonatrum kenyense]
MSDSIRKTPPRLAPLLHGVLALIAASVLYVPVLRLREAEDLSIAAIGGAWTTVSLVLLIGLLVAAVLVVVVDRGTWSRLLLLDLGVIVGLVPAVIGLVLGWSAPEGGVDGLAWGFWLAMLLLVARIPLTLWIRTHAARMPRDR